jgi:uncharacterized BrkB/YihY/UPF0761 family membrane protein
MPTVDGGSRKVPIVALGCVYWVHVRYQFMHEWLIVSSYMLVLLMGLLFNTIIGVAGPLSVTRVFHACTPPQKEDSQETHVEFLVARVHARRVGES